MAFFQIVIFCLLGLMFALPSHTSVFMSGCKEHADDLSIALIDIDYMAKSEFPIS